MRTTSLERRHESVAAAERCELCGADLSPTADDHADGRRVWLEVWAVLSNPAHGTCQNLHRLYVLASRITGRLSMDEIAAHLGLSRMSVSLVAGQLAAEYHDLADILRGSDAERRADRTGEARASGAADYAAGKVAS